MILLCGIPSEPPLAMVAERLSAAGTGYMMLDQRRWSTIRLQATVRDGTLLGTMDTTEGTLRLETVTAVYSRLMDDQRLPDVAGEDPGSPTRIRASRFHRILTEWIDTGPSMVLNRSRSQASNGSKPYQAQLIRDHGFSIPDTLITNDPASVKEFHARHGRIVFKSMSGVRSIVRELTDEDYPRLPTIRWCPVQFQELVPGTDVRVHVVGTDVFATRVLSDGIDYRYATRDGLSTDLEETVLPAGTASRCVALAEALGLPFAGIDLRISESGRIVCFEVNPSPAYSYYESHTGQPISAAVARFLSRTR